MSFPPDMSYDDFKAFVTTYLWKDGDQELIDNLDNIIYMAHSTIRVDLRLREQIRVVSEALDTSDRAPTTYPIRYVKEVWVPNKFKLEYISLPDMRRLQEERFTDPTLDPLPVYSLNGFSAELTGPFPHPDYPTVRIFGYSDAPDFEDPQVATSFLANYYMDLYVYAVLMHAAGFLREDERIAQWKQLYDDAVRRAMDSDKMFRDPPQTRPLPLPYPASPTRSRNWRHDL